MFYLFRWVWGCFFIIIGGFGYSYRRYFILIWALFAFIVWLYFGYAKKDVFDAWILAPLTIVVFPSVLVRFVFIPNGLVKASYYFGMASTYYYRHDIKGGAVLSAVSAFKGLDSDRSRLETWLLAKIDSSKDLKWTSYLSLILLKQGKGSNEYDNFVISRKYLEHALVSNKVRKITKSLEVKSSFTELGKTHIDDIRISYKKVMSYTNSSTLKDLEFFLELNNYFLIFEGLDEKLQASFVLSNKERIAGLANTLWTKGYVFFAKVLMAWLINKLSPINSVSEIDKLIDKYKWYYWVRVLSSNTNGSNLLEILKSAHKFLS